MAGFSLTLSLCIDAGVVILATLLATPAVQWFKQWKQT
jgi:hypothetical protein